MYPPSPRKQLTWQWKHVTLEDVSPIKIMWFYIVMLVFGVFFLLKQKHMHLEAKPQWFATHTDTSLRWSFGTYGKVSNMKHGGLDVCFFKGHLCGGRVFFCLINLNICRLSHFSLVFHMWEGTGEHSLEYKVTICQESGTVQRQSWHNKQTQETFPKNHSMVNICLNIHYKFSWENLPTVPSRPWYSEMV